MSCKTQRKTNKKIKKIQPADMNDRDQRTSPSYHLLLGLCVGHVNDALVTLGVANVRESNSSVSCSSLDNGATWLEEALLFGVLSNH